MHYLLFQLFGNLQAWGSPASGMIRKTDDHPTKSGILGLIAACLGIDSSREEELLQLQSSIGYSCREDIPGGPLTDFHTVRSDTSLVSYFNKIREGLPTDVKEDNLLLTYRHYLIEAFFTICLWKETEAGYDLNNISEAMSKPIFSPYMGRKCCSLGLPFGQVVVNANNLKEAFNQFIPDKSFALPDNRFVLNPRVFWEGSDTNIAIKVRHTRRDCLKSRRAWAYTQRIEYEGTLERTNRCITKVA